MTTQTETFKPWDTFYSDGASARLTYHPEWSPSKPWASFQHGTAGAHFETPRAGIRYLEDKGFSFKRNARDIWTAQGITKPAR